MKTKDILKDAIRDFDGTVIVVSHMTVISLTDLCRRYMSSEEDVCVRTSVEYMTSSGARTSRICAT